MANKIEEIALKHKLCRFVPGYGGEDEAYPNAIAALRELLEECCKEVEDESREWAWTKEELSGVLARLRALGGE